MKCFLEAALFVVSAFATGCERADWSGTHVEAPRGAPGAGGPSFTQTDARRTVAHTGVRRLEFADGGAFRERITTDGNGRYSIEPVELFESSTLEWDDFELMQRAREGFLFRYRDFLVRAPGLFARNWRTKALTETVVVAGRSCERYRVEREGRPVTFELAVDAGTGLVLSSKELDAAGEFVASMTYESFELDPDLTTVAWHVSSNEERVLDLLRSLPEQIDARPLQPRLLPAGYAPLEAATVVDGQDARWLKLTYSDGVEPLFFFQKLDELSRGNMAGPAVGDAPRTASSVMVFEVGPATAIQGKVDGHDLIVIGKAPQVELLDLIESALPDQ